ncbi:hypothetical protein DFA_11127 [Cavenderia fasciculata]|uniref:N-acetyltransferase domain-containing protein n=1 Tax=Cavenderia fasciculata TaxID=261658 RepID=F4QF07_CACFS|nr:uncharacterized protein DFA_11127 [Cavenderia fasciculata]EGG13366.1 hypothetical protein DFA_11127 [Cavenderia fasciculata]|eukprot:XP_004350070.1 hypothetical protein DFA_11127 [Cavenderia fasciculata]
MTIQDKQQQEQEEEIKWTLLTIDDLPKIHEINTVAFMEDPYLNYMFHEIPKEERQPFISDIQKAFIKQTIGSNESYCLGDKQKDGIRSVVLMLPPHVPWPEDLWKLYCDKQEEIILNQRKLTSTFDRFLAVEEYFSERFLHHDAIEGYYLLILSTDTRLHGGGLASKLLNVLFEKLDREQKSVYLECTSPKLCGYYEKMGFVAVEKGSLPHIPAELEQKYIPSVTFFKRNPKPSN